MQARHLQPRSPFFSLFPSFRPARSDRLSLPARSGWGPSESGQWLLREAAGLDAALALPSLEISIALAEIFGGVEFVPTPIRARTPPKP